MKASIAQGCRMIEPEPTPNPVEAVATTSAAVEEFVAAYPIAASSWDLQYIGEPEQPVLLLPDTRASVTYFWDRYAGFDGCGWFLGVYTADTEGLLRMQTPSQTPNVCDTPPGLYEQSALYVSAMLNVTEYWIEGEQLIADTVDNQRMLTYEPAMPVPIQGTVWDLKFWWFSDDERWVPVAPLVATSITFAEGGAASGSGGCNEYTVSYEGNLQIEKVMEATDIYAELPTLTFGPVSAQTAQCDEPDGIMEQENGLFDALGSVAYYFKMGGMTMMLDASGEPLLMFGARE